ncbi:MAG: aryl-sulfate sulfotransferase [Bacteroidia bacterium]
MPKILCLSLFLYVCTFNCIANNDKNKNVIPANNQQLNYVNVLFSFNKIDSAQAYLLCIWEDSITTTPNYDACKNYNIDTTELIIENLNWGKNYTWQYMAFVNKKLKYVSDKFYFSTLKSPFIDSTKHKLVVHKNTSNVAQNSFILNDYSQNLVTRNGKPVWYLRTDKFVKKSNFRIRDVNFTPQGTVTFMTDSNAYESTLDGKILWKALNNGLVSGEKMEYYHHDLQKLPNGNYMILSCKYIERKIGNKTIDTCEWHTEKNVHLKGKNYYAKVRYGTVIEYNPQGKVVWTWCANSYFKKAELFCNKTILGEHLPNAHMNSFNQSKDGKYVYVGFRDYSRIIKIKKQNKKVVDSWGLTMLDKKPRKSHGNFCNQHACTLIEGDKIAVLNNDSVILKNNLASSVVIINEKDGSVDWKFNLGFDTLCNGKASVMGYVQALPNKNLFVCMGQAGRMLEVTPNKEVVWDSFQTTYIPKTKKMENAPVYRARVVYDMYPTHARTTHVDYATPKIIRK